MQKWLLKYINQRNEPHHEKEHVKGWYSELIKFQS